MKTILNLIFLFSVSQQVAFAQNKQEIYTNQNIVWAGIIDIDIVIDADENMDWKRYEISGLGDKWKQYSKNLKKNQKALNEIIIERADEIFFYEYDSLKYKKEYQALDLYRPGYEPETYGDEGGRLPASAFDVFRLRCFMYYDKSEINFRIAPQAVQVLNGEDDTGETIIVYNELGWLPVDLSNDIIDVTNNDITFAKRFYRDIAFEEVNVFKREWNIEQTVDHMMENIRKRSQTISLSTTDDLDGTKQLPQSDIHHIGMDEVMDLNFDAWDEQVNYVPWLNSDYKGIRLTLDWIWNDHTKTLNIKERAFAPIHVVYDGQGEEAPYYQRLFIKKINTK